MKRMMAIVLSMTLMTGALTAQNQPGPTKATTAPAQPTATAKAPQKKAVAKKAEPTVSEQLDEMRQQIKQLSNLIESRDQKIDQLEQKLDKSQTVAVQAQTKADSAVAQTAADEQAVLALKNDFADFRTVSMGGSNGPVLRNTVWALQDPSPTGQDQQVLNKEMESPITLRFKGVNITPGGFAEAAFVRRSRELGSDLPTPFNSLTMPRFAEPTLGVFRIGPPVSTHGLRRGPRRAHGYFQLSLRRLPFSRRNLDRNPDQQLHLSSAPGVGTVEV
jgi:hypothetical protein